MLPVTPGLIIAIAAGGAAGALMRFFVQHYSTTILGLTFPWGTLFVNVLGCGIIGLISGYWTASGFEISLEIRGALVIGCLGAFTTFSAFSLDTMVLFQNGEIIRASLNVLSTVILCLVAVAIGSVMGSRLAG
ncbi:MAG: fluoride efflux transporter CrcB [Gammaproteobacteria bacterium]|nr:fluoride efflux transporter CrcB [Gammaproteobacteria bacterium]